MKRDYHVADRLTIEEKGEICQQDSKSVKQKEHKMAGGRRQSVQQKIGKRVTRQERSFADVVSLWKARKARVCMEDSIMIQTGFKHVFIYRGRYGLYLTGTGSQIIGITESCANKDIVDAELALTGYVMFRKERRGRRGGGINFRY